ncbi:MAG TPA: hypothetical protein DCQ30_07810 [Acidimicrobiaceae bacterium]|nr:hypothetical protein [Acidimicrobiaceae bacterium]
MAGGAAVAILSVAGLVALSGPAQAATSVTPGSVTVTPTTAGAGSDYSVPFTVSGSGALAPGATITLTAPDGTVWPGSASSYAIAVNNSHAATVQNVSVSDVTGPGSNSTSATANQVVITLATSTITNGDLVTVSTTGTSATNPTTASTTDVIDESTSADATPAASPHYSITAVPVVTHLVVTGGDNQSSSGAYSVPLSVTATDTYGNPVTTAAGTVTFTAPSSGASVTFAACSSNPHTYQCANALSGGVATSSTMTATGGAGSYSVTAALSSPALTSSPFALTNLPAPPGGSSVTPEAMTLSSHTEGAGSVTYTFPFVSTSALGSGSSITFLAPNGTVFPASTSSFTVANTSLGGASQTISSVNLAKAVGPGAPTTDPACSSEQGSLSGSTCTSTTNNEVVINLGTPTLVNAGNTVTVTVTGMTNPTFATSGDVVDESTSANTLPAATPAYAINPGALASIVVTSGSNQSAEVGHAFGQNLVATALDGAGNPISGVAVTFTAPSSGASATFPNTTDTQTSNTGSNGQATAQAPTANATAGQYDVTATSGAVAASPAFRLTNTTAPGTPGALTLGSNTEGASGVTYTVPFTTTAACPATCTFTLVAPNGTGLPASPGNYSVGVNNGDMASVSGVIVSAVTGPGADTVSATPNQAVISLNPSTIAAGDLLTVTITSVSNPTTASTTDVVDEATSADQTLAASPAYAINPGAASQLVVTGGDNQAAGVNEPFATPLSVTVEDAAGNTVPGAGFAVLFAAHSMGASGTFDPAGCSGNTGATPAYQCITSTNASGVATASAFTANSTAGPDIVTASADPVTNGTFNLTNVPVLTPGGITVNPDTAASSATYTVPFTTSAAGGIPASGACPANCTITLVAPNNTALPASAGSYAVTVNHNHAATVSSVAVSKVTGPGSNSVSTTNNQVVITLSASSIASGDLVTVTIAGVTSPAAAGNYQMNESTASDTIAQTSPPYAVTAGAASKVVATSGNNQAAQVGTAYAAPLTATVEDGQGNPEGAGIAVTFAAPSSGAGGTFASSGCPGNTMSTPAYQCIVATNASGVATASTLTANATPGQFTVVASSAGLTSANFTLTNETAVTPGDVTVQASTAGGSGVLYTVPFTTSASAGALGAGATITIVAPNGTTFSSTATDDGIQVNNAHAATIGSVATSAVAGPGSNSASSTNNQVVITLSASTIASGDVVTVGLGNSTNPTTASNGYQLSEATSADPIPALSPDYAITADQAATMDYLAGNNQSTQVDTTFPTQLQVQFFDQFGNPVPNWNVVFATPAGSPSATFAPCTGGNPGGNNECEVASDANGIATSSVLTADDTAGSYQGVAETSAGVSPNPILFTLTNTAAPAPPPPPPPPPPAQSNGGPVVLQQNGAPSLFVVGSGGSLLNYWYIPQTGQWGEGTVVPSGVTSPPSVQLQQNGAPTVFVQGVGGSLWNYWYIPQTGQWGAAEIASGGVASQPYAQLQPANGAPTVFVEGAGGSLFNYWYIPQTGQWGAAEIVSGGVASAPGVQLQQNGAPTVFVEGAGGSLLNYWYIPQTGQWGAGTVASGGVASQPAVQVQPANGEPTVFVKGANGSLLNYWYIPQGGSWGAAQIVSGGVTSAPSIQLQPANGAPTVFVQGGGGSLYNYWYIPQSGGWGAAEIASGGVASQPAVQLQPANGAPTLFVVTSGGAVLNYWYIPETGQWGSATVAGGGVVAP